MRPPARGAAERVHRERREPPPRAGADGRADVGRGAGAGGRGDPLRAADGGRLHRRSSDSKRRLLCPPPRRRAAPARGGLRRCAPARGIDNRAPGGRAPDRLSPWSARSARAQHHSGRSPRTKSHMPGAERDRHSPSPQHEHARRVRSRETQAKSRQGPVVFVWGRRAAPAFPRARFPRCRDVVDQGGCHLPVRLTTSPTAPEARVRSRACSRRSYVRWRRAFRWRPSPSRVSRATRQWLAQCSPGTRTRRSKRPTCGFRRRPEGICAAAPAARPGAWCRRRWSGAGRRGGGGSLRRIWIKCRQIFTSADISSRMTP